MGTKIFEANVFVILKALPKFTKILSHRNLEPYGIQYESYLNSAYFTFHSAVLNFSQILINLLKNWYTFKDYRNPNS